MPLKPWKKLRQVFELKNPWWTYRKDELLLPTGKQGEYHLVHTNGSSMIIPFLDDGKMVLVNQFRYLAGRESVEFPCGAVKEGSSYEQTAAEELAEETGFQARDLKWIAEFNPYNGVTDETCRVFAARNLYPVEATPDETEELEHVHISVEEFERMVHSGEIWDGMTLAAWALAKGKILP